MKQSKIMRERIRRVKILFAELGYEVVDPEERDGAFTAGFQNETGFQAGFYIDEESRFLELAFSFTFSHSLSGFLRSKMEDVLRLCYEYGSYFNLQKLKKETTLTIFTKIYFIGLNYYALKETLRDFQENVGALRELVEIKSENKKGDAHGDS
ncbi:MAG: hypothetical protein LBQ57_08195 [Spirochaetales bacterium]|nr:hypothetical protein [Spirochaetales bacterium]